MAKANPQKWFPSKYTVQIRFRKVDRWAESRMATEPYFGTWEEAHAQSVVWAAAALSRATREAESAKRAIAAAHKRIRKVEDMKPPNV